MSEDGREADEALWRAAEMVALCERIDEIEQLVSEHPSLVAPEFLDQLDHKIDEIEQTGRGDWWGLTRARVLLGGCHDGVLNDALFRCWTRDLPLRNCLLGGRHELEPERPGLRAEPGFAVTPMGGFGRGQPTLLVGLAGGD